MSKTRIAPLYECLVHPVISVITLNSGKTLQIL